MGALVNINIFVLIFIVTIVIIIKSLILSKNTKLTIGYPTSSFLNFTETTTKNHYSSEEHSVITEDGYILTIFRVIKGRNCKHPKKRRPVLIMHGLLQNSDVFLDAGTNAGLAYLLSDSCYDVWVGNQRGNNYARKHLRLDPDKDADFWQFSVDEMGFYDIPATIDYILYHTSADKINFIGLSQSCGAYFSMCSERPDYCNKTAFMVALAPGVLVNHEGPVLLVSVIKVAVYFQRIFEMFGVHEVLSKGSFGQELLEFLCQITGVRWIEVICKSYGLMDNFSEAITSDTQRLIFSHFPVGTSLKNLVRYGQALHADGKFQKYDYGNEINLKRYNTTQSPEYNLKAVQTPVLLIQGKEDKVVKITYINKILLTKLPNLLEMVEVSDWTHIDMVYHRDIKKITYPKINEYLEIYSGK